MIRFAVAGFGLIGGSICRAAKKRMPGCTIAAADTDKNSLESALSQKIIDVKAEVEDLPSGNYDIIFVSLPVVSSVGVLSSLLDGISGDTLLVDTGSVKSGIIDSLKNHPSMEKFVPCHPMAGSEKAGFPASTDSLFENAWVILAPHSRNKKEDIERAAVFWRMLGARVICSDPLRHDSAVAFTSHMPHLVSSAVASAAGTFFKESPDCSFAPFIGRGFQDVTRLAAGSPGLWRDICVMNRVEVGKALDTVIDKLKDVRMSLSSGLDDDIFEFLEEGSVFKRGLEMRPIVVAVDGPAGSGKSSVSKEVAQRAGLFYIDSGAIYRSITWFMLEKFTVLEPAADYGSIASREMTISQEFLPDGVSRTFVNGQNVSDLIRDEKITANIGRISDNKGVRDFVTGLLRTWAGEKPVIMDGRDIGTVVFPNADVKIYCDASARVRAERRVNEYREKGKNVDVKEVESQIILRDQQDRSRKFGALKVADDAVILDTSDLTKEQVIAHFLELIRKNKGA